MLKFSDIFYSNPNSGQMTSQSKNNSSDSLSQKMDQDTNTDKKSEEQMTEDNLRSPDNPLLSETGNDIWVVNKRRPLSPKDYRPDDLVFPNVDLRVPGNESMQIRSNVAKNIKNMFDDAKSDGLKPLFSSGFRSYSYQVSLYGGYENSIGQTEADKQSARPGYSEHQTGLAFDICNTGDCNLEQSFENTPLGKWVAENSHKYGFTLRYQKGKEAVTGYMYEPWHLRYVGQDLATRLYEKSMTLEEYFNLPPAPDYKD